VPQIAQAKTLFASMTRASRPLIAFRLPRPDA